MRRLTTATLSWLNDGCCDIKYLDIWDKAPINYTPGYPIDTSWYSDQYEEILGKDLTGRLFRRARVLLLHYQFYPPNIMSHTSDFSLEQRPMRVGDRIVQRIHVICLHKRPLLDVLGLNEIYQVVDKPRQAGFTYVTTEPHVEQGEWTALVEWQLNQNVVLTIRAISRPSLQEPARNHRFMRKFQQTAHQRGIAYFRHLLFS